MKRPRLRLAPAVLCLLAATLLPGCGGNAPFPAGAPAMKMASSEPNAKPPAEEYEKLRENPYVRAKDQALATFSTAVDTASYSNARRFLREGRLPPKEAIRVADFVNSFDYDYPPPEPGRAAGIRAELAPCPWFDGHLLLRVAVKAKEIPAEELPARNFVFLIDTSGSMSGDARLPLVQKSLDLLVDGLTGRDRVSVVTYAGSAGLRLPPTPGTEKARIRRAIDGLDAGGSTNGGGGLKMAYEQAEKSFIPGGLNRVILATDGDFNVGISDPTELVKFIETKRETGVYLSVLGYGMGNLKDRTLEKLAHHGNGHYAYIDTIAEAKKLFVEKAGALAVVAKDVKVQVQFNPERIKAYRLIGYENRLLRNDEFRDDAVDAGEMGAGHACTALFEVVPEAAGAGSWLTARMRYLEPDTGLAREVSNEVGAEGLRSELSADGRFAAAAAGFGMMLAGSQNKGDLDFGLVERLAEGAMGADPGGHRRELLELARVAKRLRSGD